MSDYPNAVERALKNKLGEHPSLLDFIPESKHAAIREGTIDEDLTTYAQNMIDAIDARGGELFLTPGLYTIDGTLVIGDGAAGTLSSRLNVRLIGAGRGLNYDSDTKSSVTIKRRGTSTDPLIRVDGPIVGIEIANLTLNCAGYAENGIEVWSSSACKIYNVNVLNNTKQAIELRTRGNTDPIATGENEIGFINIKTSETLGSGISFGNETGQTTIDTLRTNVHDIFAEVGAQGYGLRFNIADSIWVDGLFTYGAMAGIALCGEHGSGYPSSIVFSNVYPSATGTTYVVSNAEDNGAGKVKLTTEAHPYNTGDFVSVMGVVGVPANGYHEVTVPDSTHLVLDDVTFSGAYISGGIAGPTTIAVRDDRSTPYYGIGLFTSLGAESGALLNDITGIGGIDTAGNFFGDLWFSRQMTSATIAPALRVNSQYAGTNLTGAFGFYRYKEERFRLIGDYFDGLMVYAKDGTDPMAKTWAFLPTGPFVPSGNRTRDIGSTTLRVKEFVGSEADFTAAAVNRYGHVRVDRPNAGALGGTVVIRNTAGTTGAAAALAFELDNTTAFAADGTPEANIVLVARTTASNNAADLEFWSWDGSTEAIGGVMKAARRWLFGTTTDNTTDRVQVEGSLAAGTLASDFWRIGAGSIKPNKTDATQDIGDDTYRVGSVYGKNLDLLKLGTFGNYARIRQLELYNNADDGGLTPLHWKQEVIATLAGSRYWTVKDNAGDEVIRLERALLGATTNDGTIDLHWSPKTNGDRDLGASARAWRWLWADGVRKLFKVDYPSGEPEVKLYANGTNRGGIGSISAAEFEVYAFSGDLTLRPCSGYRVKLSPVYEAFSFPAVAEPTVPADGDVYYDSTDECFYFREDGSWTALGAGLVDWAESSGDLVTSYSAGNRLITMTGDGRSGGLNVYAYGSDGTDPRGSVLFYGSRGTLASPTASQAGDRLGIFGAFGRMSAAWATYGSALIGFYAAGTGGQGEISFRTYDGSSMAERWQVDYVGHLLPGASATYDIGTDTNYVNYGYADYWAAVTAFRIKESSTWYTGTSIALTGVPTLLSYTSLKIRDDSGTIQIWSGSSWVDLSTYGTDGVAFSSVSATNKALTFKGGIITSVT